MMSFIAVLMFPISGTLKEREEKYRSTWKSAILPYDMSREQKILFLPWTVLNPCQAHDCYTSFCWLIDVHWNHVI